MQTTGGDGRKGGLEFLLDGLQLTADLRPTILNFTRVGQTVNPGDDIVKRLLAPSQVDQFLLAVSESAVGLLQRKAAIGCLNRALMFNRHEVHVLDAVRIAPLATKQVNVEMTQHSTRPTDNRGSVPIAVLANLVWQAQKELREKLIGLDR